MVKRLEKNYVSDTDQLLQEFDQQHPEKSSSQQHEIAKHGRIAKLRDDAKAKEKTNPIWEDF